MGASAGMLQGSEVGGEGGELAVAEGTEAGQLSAARERERS